MYLEQFGISTKYNYVIPQFETNLLIFCTVLSLFIPLNTYLSIYPQVNPRQHSHPTQTNASYTM